MSTVVVLCRLLEWRFGLVAAAGTLALLMSTGFAAQQQEPPVAADTCAAEYVIGQEDVLEISVWNNTAVTRTVPVRPDGKISLPLVDDVQAAGLTPMQLRERLIKALTAYIPAPSVSVIVREVHSVKVTVIGQVKTPGRYELKDRATVLDLLAMAGGLTEYAVRDRIAVLRQDGETTRRIRFPYENLVSNNGWKNEARSAQENLCLRPGDIILVP
jgi:polysaccharide biosynthesis/export protein